MAQPVHRENVPPTTRPVTTVENWGTSPKYVVRRKCPNGKYDTSVRTYTKRLDSMSECDVYIGMVKSLDNDNIGLKWSEHMTLCVNDKVLNFKLDTDSDINIIYREDYV